MERRGGFSRREFLTRGFPRRNLAAQDVAPIGGGASANMVGVSVNEVVPLIRQPETATGLGKDAPQVSSNYTFDELVSIATDVWAGERRMILTRNERYSVRVPFISARTRASQRDHRTEWSIRKGISTRNVRYDRRHIEMIFDTLIRMGQATGKARTNYLEIGIDAEFLEKVKTRLFPEDNAEDKIS